MRDEETDAISFMQRPRAYPEVFPFLEKEGILTKKWYYDYGVGRPTDATIMNLSRESQRKAERAKGTEKTFAGIRVVDRWA